MIGMRVIVLLLALCSICATVQAVELTEEQLWESCFGPVTEAEKEVFPDWRAERRRQYAIVIGPEPKTRVEINHRAILIAEKQASDGYAIEMSMLAEQKRQAAALAKIPVPKPRKLHTSEAQVVIDNVKAAYTRLQNYHEQMRIWQFMSVPDSKPWMRLKVYEGELWFNRALGARGKVVVSRSWARSQADMWSDDSCIAELARDRKTLTLDEFEFNKACENLNPIDASPISKYIYRIEQQGLTAALLLVGDFKLPRTNMAFECRIPKGHQDTLLCIQPTYAGAHSSTVIQFDPATYLIRNIRWDSSNMRSLVEYTQVDSTRRITAADLRHEMPADAKSWIEKRQAEETRKRAEIDAHMAKIQAMRKEGRLGPRESLPMRAPGIQVPKSAEGAVMAAMMLAQQPALKEMARQCNASASGQMAADPALRDSIDAQTGKAWSKIYEECRLQMTPPIVFETPPVFSPCPDWIKTCEEQLL